MGDMWGRGGGQDNRGMVQPVFSFPMKKSSCKLTVHRTSPPIIIACAVHNQIAPLLFYSVYFMSLVDGGLI